MKPLQALKSLTFTIRSIQKKMTVNIKGQQKKNKRIKLMKPVFGGVSKKRKDTILQKVFSYCKPFTISDFGRAFGRMPASAGLIPISFVTPQIRGDHSAVHDQRSNNMNCLTIYHYTDIVSAFKIYKSGKIRASRDLKADAKYGEGVYGSIFGPERGKRFNSENNYGKNLCQEKEDEGKLDCAIKIEMSNENVEEIITDDRRSILLYKNEDINLHGSNVYSFEFIFGTDVKKKISVNELLAFF